MDNNSKSWKSYEEVAQYLLDMMADQFGLSKVEGKQGIVGQRSGTTYEIDAKGIAKHGQGFVIIECRRYTTSKQKQENLAALAYRIIDTGAEGGIIVSPLGLQEGGSKIAQSENIVSVRLDENSTTKSYVLQFLNNCFAGFYEPDEPDTFSADLIIPE
ncbi:MAG: hypothetical protein WAO19_02460 [Candidatus Kryptoniota bacterium]